MEASPAMNLSRWQLDSAVVAAMAGSATVGAQYIASKAARDALFLTNFEPSSLPTMTIITSIFAIVLVVVCSRVLKRISPATWVPIGFAIAALLMLAEWAITASAPGQAARMLYLQVSGIGPLLGSGFWLITSERFDPHTAKKHFGQIAGAGTLGGLIGGLAGDRVSAIWDINGLLPLLAFLNVVCAVQLRWLGRSSAKKRPSPARVAASSEPEASGLHALSEARYLQTLVWLVFLGTIAAEFIDQAFKTEVRDAYGRGPALGTFFSRYYTALSLVTFLVQTGASRLVLERFGLAAAAGAPALTFLIGGATTALVPGLWSIVATRWSEAALRNSVYRSAYELFFTPVAPREKRAVKSIIDVGVDRTGDMVGAGIITQILWIPQPNLTRVLVALAMGCSAVALVVASRLRRGYMQTLEKSLLNRAVELDLSDIEDLTTRTAMLQTLRMPLFTLSSTSVPTLDSSPPVQAPPPPAVTDPAVDQIVTLRSRDREAILRVLRAEDGLPAALIPHAIPLLAWDEVAQDGIRALRGIAEEHVGELIDALLDPNQPFAVRRRLARVFSVCVSQRAADGLLLGLEDLRFEVRFQCGRSLLSIVEKNPRVRIDKERIVAIVLQEAAVSQSVWQGRKLLDGPEEGDRQSFLEELIKDRADQSLAHVFTLLALILPTEPLRIAFRGLHTDDQGLRGTALEYLESVLPPNVRERLWPFVEDRRRPRRQAGKPGDEALAELLRSNQSIMINLEELKRRAESTGWSTT